VHLDEFGLIRRLTSTLPAPRSDVRIGIGDDAAVLKQQVGEELLVTTDAMVEGVHFRTDTLSYADVGYKSVAVSISDIAAMGGVPRHVTIAIAIPQDTPVAALDELYAGVGAVCADYACTVVGGDVVSTSGPLVLTTTVLGSAPAGAALLRSGAQPGDVVFVTGSLGASAAGLAYLSATKSLAFEAADELLLAHRRPKPQVTAGQILQTCGAHACNDVSDGLASELNEIAVASGVRLRIEAVRIPMAAAVRNFARQTGQDALDYAYYGGEDYQLVGTATAFAFARALMQCEGVGIQLTQIGRVEVGDGVVATDASGTHVLLQPRGYNHFAQL